MRMREKGDFMQNCVHKNAGMNIFRPVAQKHVESGQHHYGIGRDVHKSIIALSRGGRKRGEMPKGR